MLQANQGPSIRLGKVGAPTAADSWWRKGQLLAGACLKASFVAAAGRDEADRDRGAVLRAAEWLCRPLGGQHMHAGPGVAQRTPGIVHGHTCPDCGWDARLLALLQHDDVVASSLTRCLGGACSGAGEQGGGFPAARRVCRTAERDPGGAEGARADLHLFQCSACLPPTAAVEPAPSQGNESLLSGPVQGCEGYGMLMLVQVRDKHRPAGATRCLFCIHVLFNTAGVPKQHQCFPATICLGTLNWTPGGLVRFRVRFREPHSASCGRWVGVPYRAVCEHEVHHCTEPVHAPGWVGHCMLLTALWALRQACRGSSHTPSWQRCTPTSRRSGCRTRRTLTSGRATLLLHLFTTSVKPALPVACMHSR